MSSNPENLIHGLPRRPRTADASTNTILAAIVGGLLTGGLGGVVLGGLAGNALSNQRQPLEMAIRQYLAALGLEVIFFHRAPRAVKVTFRYRPSSFWTIESVMPDSFNLSPDDTDDWLYGNLIVNVLPSALNKFTRPMA